jgi:DNA-binding protein YbaB
MFDKIMQAQQMAGEMKKRLSGITVSGSVEGGKITVTANANKVIESLSIDEEFLKSADKEELEELWSKPTTLAKAKWPHPPKKCSAILVDYFNLQQCLFCHRSCSYNSLPGV